MSLYLNIKLYHLLSMIIANKYKILKEIGKGAFGKVYKGENIRTKELMEKSNLLNMKRKFIKQLLLDKKRRDLFK